MLGPTPAWQKTEQGRLPVVPLCSSEVRAAVNGQQVVIEGSSFNGIFNMLFTQNADAAWFSPFPVSENQFRL